MNEHIILYGVCITEFGKFSRLYFCKNVLPNSAKFGNLRTSIILYSHEYTHTYINKQTNTTQQI